jgi:hypothetical protein
MSWRLTQTLEDLDYTGDKVRSVKIAHRQIVRSACFSEPVTDSCTMQAVEAGATAPASWAKNSALCDAHGQRECIFFSFGQKIVTFFVLRSKNLFLKNFCLKRKSTVYIILIV